MEMEARDFGIKHSETKAAQNIKKKIKKKNINSLNNNENRNQTNWRFHLGASNVHLSD